MSSLSSSVFLLKSPIPIKYEGKIEVRQRKVKECKGLRETLEIIYLDFSLERSNLYELILSHDGYRIPDILMPPAFGT